MFAGRQCGRLSVGLATGIIHSIIYIPHACYSITIDNIHSFQQSIKKDSECILN